MFYAFVEDLHMPNVYIVSATDPKNITYREELAHSLRREESITIEHDLANCQVMILLQTVELAQLPHIRTLLRSATRLFQQQRLQEIIRFVYEDIEPLPTGWERLTVLDARESPIAATKQLTQHLLHLPKRESAGGEAPSPRVQRNTEPIAPVISQHESFSMPTSVPIKPSSGTEYPLYTVTSFSQEEQFAGPTSAPEPDYQQLAENPFDNYPTVSSPTPPPAP